MKLIIDIPDNDYKFIKDLQSLIIGGRGNCRTIQRDVINAIKNGTPYEERSKGKWEVDELRNTVCSICGGIRRDSRVDHVSYCNKCGARMER